MTTDKPRYSITLDEELFQKVEDFRFERRFSNRNQATIELIRIGLNEVKKRQRAEASANSDADKLDRLINGMDSEEKNA